ncbi:hypothetical protein Godav_028704 [Gossypium davidsonii]|uniref:Uncharacterized protein n=2 Tax=Gossypium TaxID=3633 RepID=A0A7J8S092_GOSDV|nr:hypothetical protein [Gossypium davidsonii]MBA0654914.1 hypothetical protein [Gossypium klotzschianum]
MSRPWLLVFVVFIVMLTSQFEWKQQFGEEIEPTSTVSLKDQSLSKRQEYVKEKIILSQERNIQKLNEQVRNLREQLLWCKAETEISNASAFALSEHLSEIEQQPMLDD